MRYKCKLFILILAFYLCLFVLTPYLDAEQALTFPHPEQTISMDFQDARLKDILKIFSIQSGLNFIASEIVQDRIITLYFDNVPIKEAMDKLFEANNLSYELEKDSNVIIVKDWGKPTVETVTKIFSLKHYPLPSSNIKKEMTSKLGSATGADILTSLKDLLSSNGKIAEDAKTNSLIITDIPSRFPVIEQIIAQLDVPVPQVLIDVEILDVSKNTVDKLGFEFGNNPLTFVYPWQFSPLGKNFFIGPLANMYKAGGVTFGKTYFNILDFFRSQADTKFLARPRILTLNNESAEITITKDEIVGKEETTTTTTTGTTTSTKYLRSSDLKNTSEGVGVFLRVTPQINLENNEVTMVLHPKTSVTIPAALAGLSSTQADSEVRTTKSVVKVKDGETVIIGGLIHTEKQLTTKKIPFLGDIPFLGAFFTHKNKTKDTERELIVFITPHIIKDSIEFAQAKMNVPEREQGTIRAINIKRQKVLNEALSE